ncbi:MAG TPA: FadR/GntR family transcriptional regulator [Kofleriaceae bacterium]|nr:FadR/GntR family transcriptional regulator [Kofleriaceae bacterium]
MLKPVERQRVADEIVEQLRSLILTGQYRPGAKLPPERELAKTLGVNRASLREALKKLEHMGLVRIRQGDGTRVENFMETAGLELVTYLVPLARSGYPDIIRDALEFRRLIAREVARLAAGRVEPADLVRLEEIARGAGEPGLDQAEVFARDFDFYIALTAVARNRLVGLLVNTVREAIKSYTGILMHVIVEPEFVRAHHRRLLAALEQRDAEAAVAAVDDFMVRGSEHVLRLVDEGRLWVHHGGEHG